jgi:hypothetical protein
MSGPAVHTVNAMLTIPFKLPGQTNAIFEIFS